MMAYIYQAAVPLFARETLLALEVTVCSLVLLCTPLSSACPWRAHLVLRHRPRQVRARLRFPLCRSRLLRLPRLTKARSETAEWPEFAESSSKSASGEGTILFAQATRLRHGRNPIGRIRPWAI
jgi:hypothetical protein